MRLRITFSKEGWLIYSSHLDLMRVWERALRRAAVPLAYSGGFNPRPKLQLARALPLGHVGEAELIDIFLDEPVSQADLAKSLVPVLPEGLSIREIKEIKRGAPAMQTQVIATEYRVIVDWEPSEADASGRIEELLARPVIPARRRGKEYDLRPLIEALRLDEVRDGEAVLRMRLSARPGATGRPETVLESLGLGDAFARYHRTRVILEDSGLSASGLEACG